MAWGEGEFPLSTDKLQWQQQLAESFLEKLGAQAQGEATLEGSSPTQRLLGPTPLAAAGPTEFASELATFKEATPLHRGAAVEVPFGPIAGNAGGELGGREDGLDVPRVDDSVPIGGAVGGLQRNGLKALP